MTLVFVCVFHFLNYIFFSSLYILPCRKKINGLFWFNQIHLGEKKKKQDKEGASKFIE